MKMIDNRTADSVKALVNYLYDDEHRNYEETYDIELGESPSIADMERHHKAHIFNDVIRVFAWLTEKQGSNPHVKITPFDSPRSNKPVANQWVITTDDGEFFQSYKSIIAFQPFGGGKTVLDASHWDYSTTTGKYRNEFLGEGIEETRKKIADGTYLLADLNQS